MASELDTRIFKLRPMTLKSLADRRALHSIWTRCFREEPSVSWYYHIPSSARLGEKETAEAVDHAKIAYTNRLPLDPRAQILSVQDENGHNVGISVWDAPSNDKSLWRKQSWTEYLWSLAYRLWDTLMIPIARRLVNVGYILEKRERWAAVQNGFGARHIAQSDKKNGYWYLSWLGVLPTHGRRGIGQQLLQWGLDRADERDQAIYLSASPQGVGLYRKAGFEVMEALLCYPEEEKGNWTESYMRRPPRSERERATKKIA